MLNDPLYESSQPPTQYLRPADFSPVRFALQALLMVGTAAAAVYFAVWRGEWIGAALGGFAGLCVYLPLFGWLEFKQDAATTETANVMLRAHKIATDAFVQRRLNGAQEWLMAEREKDRTQIEQVKAERDTLANRLEPFVAPRERGAHGRYIASRPKAIRHGKKVAPPIAHESQPQTPQLTIEGNPE